MSNETVQVKEKFVKELADDFNLREAKPKKENLKEEDLEDENIGEESEEEASWSQVAKSATFTGLNKAETAEFIKWLRNYKGTYQLYIAAILKTNKASVEDLSFTLKAVNLPYFLLQSVVDFHDDEEADEDGYNYFNDASDLKS